MSTHLAPVWPRAGVGLLVASPALLLAACGGSSGSGSAQGGGGATNAATSAHATTVETHSGDMGTFLTDGSGRTVYLFAADHGNTSACNGACVTLWPPVTVKGSTQATGQAKTGMLGTITRSDGSKQVTYAGHPLYYYTGDQAAGAVNGQGSNQFGASWWVVSPTGKAITQSSGGSSSTPSPTSSSSGSSSGSGGGWG